MKRTKHPKNVATTNQKTSLIISCLLVILLLVELFLIPHIKTAKNFRTFELTSEIVQKQTTDLTLSAKKTIFSDFGSFSGNKQIELEAFEKQCFQLLQSLEFLKKDAEKLSELSPLKLVNFYTEEEGYIKRTPMFVGQSQEVIEEYLGLITYLKVVLKTEKQLGDSINKIVSLDNISSLIPKYQSLLDEAHGLEKLMANQKNIKIPTGFDEYNDYLVGLIGRTAMRYTELYFAGSSSRLFKLEAVVGKFNFLSDDFDQILSQKLEASVENSLTLQQVSELKDKIELIAF